MNCTQARLRLGVGMIGLGLALSGAGPLGSGVPLGNAVWAADGDSGIKPPGSIGRMVETKKKKQSKPKLKLIRNRGRVPSGVVFSIRKPVLKGSTLVNRLSFLYKVESAITDELEYQAKAKRACAKTPRLRLTANTQANIYKGRYASVVMQFKGRWCKGKKYTSVRSFTLDLKRTKLVKTSQLATLKGQALQWELIKRLYNTVEYRRGLIGPKGTTLVPSSVKALKGWTKMPPVKGWLINRKGIVFYLATNARGVVKVPLVWAVLRQQVPKVGGHGLDYGYYTGTGWARLVAPVPRELSPAGVGSLGGRWVNQSQGVELTIAASHNRTSVAAEVAAETAKAAAAGKITGRTWDGKVLTLLGQSNADPKKRFIVRREFGRKSSVRIAWAYPAAAQAWVQAWAATVATTRHASLS